MERNEFWKNFNLGTELDISGAFIFNGLKALDNMETFYHEQEVFEVLYNLSVGIERLEKVVITLIEHHEKIDQDVFEKSLITHNHLELLTRIKNQRELKISNIHNKFLQILTEFYKSMRYDRYSLKEVEIYDKEKRALIRFLELELKIKYSEEMFMVTQNDNRIKKFIGNIVGKIASELYKLVRAEAHRLNIYTYEIRSDSKASKIFLSEKYDFIDERYLIKELIVFLMNTKSKNERIEFIQEIKPLDFDIALLGEYMKCFQNILQCQAVMDEADELYHEVENVGERLKMLDIIDSEYVNFIPEEDNEERDKE